MIPRIPQQAMAVVCILMMSTTTAANPQNHSPKICPLPANMTAGCTCRSDPEFEVKCIDANLTSLPTDLPNSDILVVEDNDIMYFDKVPYTALITLHLKRNGLRWIKDGAFADLQNLKELSLAHNLLGSLDPRTFLGLHNLKMLTLEDNPLFAITANTFAGSNLANLETLMLSHCQLYAIADNALTSLANLRFLNTSHNYLAEMPVIDCPNHSLHAFHSWDLSHNHLREIRLRCDHMTTLERLDLSYNWLTSLGEDSLVGAQHSLVSLDIRGNNVSYIDEKTFAKCDKLGELDISFNAMRKMSEDTIAWKQMTKLLVHDNPWDCGCETSWLINQAVIIQWNIEATVRCASPSDAEGHSVYEVNASLFNSCDSDHKRQVRIAMGVILSVSIVIAFTLFVYHQITKKKARQAQSRGHSLGGTPSYHRMQTDTDLAFSIDDERSDELANGTLAFPHTEPGPIAPPVANAALKI